MVKARPPSGARLYHSLVNQQDQVDVVSMRDAQPLFQKGVVASGSADNNNRQSQLRDSLALDRLQQQQQQQQTPAKSFTSSARNLNYISTQLCTVESQQRQHLGRQTPSEEQRTSLPPLPVPLPLPVEPPLPPSKLLPLPRTGPPLSAARERKLSSAPRGFASNVFAPGSSNRNDKYSSVPHCLSLPPPPPPIRPHSRPIGSPPAPPATYVSTTSNIRHSCIFNNHLQEKQQQQPQENVSFASPSSAGRLGSGNNFSKPNALSARKKQRMVYHHAEDLPSGSCPPTNHCNYHDPMFNSKLYAPTNDKEQYYNKDFKPKSYLTTSNHDPFSTDWHFRGQNYSVEPSKAANVSEHGAKRRQQRLCDLLQCNCETPKHISEHNYSRNNCTTQRSYQNTDRISPFDIFIGSEHNTNAHQFTEFTPSKAKLDDTSLLLDGVRENVNPNTEVPLSERLHYKSDDSRNLHKEFQPFAVSHQSDDKYTNNYKHSDFSCGNNGKKSVGSFRKSFG